MVDCELRFRCGKTDITKCLEKSFLHNEQFPKVFESNSITGTREYMQQILINAIITERNYFGEEYNLFAELIAKMLYLEHKGIEPKNFYCEIALR